jgi:uncharacterized protein (DUF58 family)
MTAPALPTNSYLDPSVLARIGNLELLARTVVEGFINGLHRSPLLGASTDFAEHRAYMPGDDIRRIDWRLFARSDRHYVKEYEADTNTNFNVILDISPSMRYGANAEEGTPSKLTYACYLAACLTYFSSLQRDRVALATIDTDIVDYVPPSAKHLQLILHTLDRVDKRTARFTTVGYWTLRDDKMKGPASLGLGHAGRSRRRTCSRAECVGALLDESVDRERRYVLRGLRPAALPRSALGRDPDRDGAAGQHGDRLGICSERWKGFCRENAVLGGDGALCLGLPFPGARTGALRGHECRAHRSGRPSERTQAEYHRAAS